MSGLLKTFATIEEDPAQSLGRLAGRLFFDPWLAIIGTGALGHQLHVPFLFHLSYWNLWLVCFVLQALWPIESKPKLNIKIK